jgi:integrase
MSRKRPNGGGSIYQRKDGRYEAAAYVTHADGTTRRLRVYAATWDEANKALTKALADHHAGLPAQATGGPNLAAYLDDWLENIARHHLRATTFPQYARTVHLHIVPYLGPKKLAKLTAQDVRAWYNTMRKTCQCCRQGIDAGRGLLRQRCCAQGRCCNKLLSERTLHYIHSVLVSALAHAVREDILPRNVAKQVQVPLGQSRPIDPLTTDEAKALLKTTAEHPNAALYEIAIRLGLRRGEILGLRWRDIDLTSNTLTVNQTLVRITGQGIAVSKPKSEAAHRALPMPDPVTRALLARRAQQTDDREIADTDWTKTDLVFTGPTGKPLEPTGIHGEFQRLCDQAAIRRVRFHDLRHTCATLLLESGVDIKTIQHILGHANINITASTYAHVRRGLQHDAVNRLTTTLDGETNATPEPPAAETPTDDSDNTDR